MPRAKRPTEEAEQSTADQPAAEPAAAAEEEGGATVLVDDEDLDDEMIDALRELSCHQNAAAQAELDR